jgi:tagatose 1,6-diphosphate aldolase
VNSIIDPGKIRGLQRVTSADGYFLICALDHLSDFAELLAPDPTSVTFADVVAEEQRQLVAGLAAECAELSLPLVVEPIWYPLPGEDPTTAEWKADRVRGIIASAAAANKLGVDMLKVEFPGYVDTAEGRAQAAAACAELDSVVSVPWVILSAGVGYADFKTQVEIACQAGAAGYLAGRSIWRDAVSTHDPAAREQAIAAARERLEELNAVTRRYGRPFTPAWPLDVVVKELPAEWYRS